jgi:hypothetical protein
MRSGDGRATRQESTGFLTAREAEELEAVTMEQRRQEHARMAARRRGRQQGGR